MRPNSLKAAGAVSLTDRPLRLGTAGWSIPASCRDRADSDGSHLERYARVMNAVEINTSFYRPHQRKTYERWARTTPGSFRFAVKVPQTITHEGEPASADLDRFIQESAGLGEKLAVLLVQFPPGKEFDKDAAMQLFDNLRARTKVHLVCEPHHASWFTDEVDQWLSERRISRVAADPSRVPGADKPGAWQGLVYFRLHGSPRIYYSSYDDDFLQTLRLQLSALQKSGDVWCIFDNTAAGCALENALTLLGDHSL